MKEVRIYIESSVKTPKRLNGKVGFVVEKMDNESEAISGIAPVQQQTAHQSEMTALYKALWNVKEPSHLVIFTDSDFLKASIGWLPGWKENNWTNARGKEIANKEAWELIGKKLEGHEIEFRIKEHHSYKKWLIANTK